MDAYPAREWITLPAADVFETCMTLIKIPFSDSCMKAKPSKMWKLFAELLYVFKDIRACWKEMQSRAREYHPENHAATDKCFAATWLVVSFLDRVGGAHQTRLQYPDDKGCLLTRFQCLMKVQAIRGNATSTMAICVCLQPYIMCLWKTAPEVLHEAMM